MAERGVIYTIWGNGNKYETALERSRRSLAAIHPELPVEVIRRPAASGSRGLAEKSHMFAASPFRETLYLDIDTVVLGRLDFGFEKAKNFGLACCINECPWARRYSGLSERRSAIEYNTGVLFFTELARPVFDTWEQLTPKLDSSMQLVRDGQLARMAFNDQGAFAAAVEQCKFNPFVLPLNWNFRPDYYYSFFGPIVIWHEYADVPPGIIDLNRYYERWDSVIQFHFAAPAAPAPPRSGTV
jgi:hypothetical protein